MANNKMALFKDIEKIRDLKSAVSAMASKHGCSQDEMLQLMQLSILIDIKNSLESLPSQESQEFGKWFIDNLDQESFDFGDSGKSERS